MRRAARKEAQRLERELERLSRPARRPCTEEMAAHATDHERLRDLTVRLERADGRARARA